MKEPPRGFTGATIQLYCACFIGFFCATMNGYDGSLINNLLANNTFLTYYNGENAGIWAGIVTSMYQIGGVVSLPFVGPAADTFGRRFGMWIGCVCIIIGTVIQGVATQSEGVKQFMGGRFLLGFGVNIAAAAGPMYGMLHVPRSLTHSVMNRALKTGLWNVKSGPQLFGSKDNPRF